MRQGLQFDYLQTTVRKGPCSVLSWELYLEALNHRLGGEVTEQETHLEERRKDSGG